jgi:hypothetical protein
MKCTLFLAAQSILVDYQTRRASAINIIDSFSSPTFPFLLQLSILAAFEKDQDGSSGTFKINISLDGAPLLSPINVDMVIVPEANGAKNITTLGALVVTNPGTILLSLDDESKEQDKKTIATYSLKVVPANIPQQ